MDYSPEEIKNILQHYEDKEETNPQEMKIRTLMNKL